MGYAPILTLVRLVRAVGLPGLAHRGVGTGCEDDDVPIISALTEGLSASFEEIGKTIAAVRLPGV